MIITYLRSSSYSAYSMCPMSFYLGYTLGLGPRTVPDWRFPKPQFKADKGNVVHKSLELLARQKVARQEGKSCFRDDELGSFDCALDVHSAHQASWDHFKRTLSHWDWSEVDYSECLSWTKMATEYCGGTFDPGRRQVLWPEKQFDITIERSEARYCWELADGRVLQGQLAIKGTMDLVCHVDSQPGTIEMVDWKTGQRKDWATGKVKDYGSLRQDPQLRMYHYALCKLLPDIRHILVTIVFIRDGGPFTVEFGPDECSRTEDMLIARFRTIKNCLRPPLIKDRASERWKCERLCPFELNKSQSGKSLCEHISGELVQLGMEKVTAKYAGDFKHIVQYGDGGGRKAQ